MVHVRFVHSGLDELTLYTLCYPAVTPAIVSSLISSYPSYFGGVQALLPDDVNPSLFMATRQALQMCFEEIDSMFGGLHAVCFVDHHDE